MTYRTRKNHNFIPDDLTNYKVVKRFQFAMNKMKAWQGSYGVSNFYGIVSPAYFVFDLEGANPNYFHTAIRSNSTSLTSRRPPTGSASGSGTCH